MNASTFAAVVDLRRDGVKWRLIADQLGYPDGDSLCQAMHAHRPGILQDLRRERTERRAAERLTHAAPSSSAWGNPSSVSAPPSVGESTLSP